MILDLVMRNLHGKQLDIKQSPAKRKVVVCGRRVGKTTLTADIAIDGFLDGRRVLYCAPTSEQTGAFWDEVLRILSPLIKAGVVYKNETKKLIKADGFGRIQAKTGHRADSLRGDTGDIVFMDEYSLMDDDVWDKVIAPMTLDTDATIYFTFTPKRKNHAYKTYLRAISDGSGRWQAWNFSSHENPHLDAQAMAEITQDMTQQAYHQEIMAEFLDSEGQVFRNITANLTSDGICNCGHSADIVAGIDWGKLNDYTVISVGCRNCRKELFMDRFNRIDYRLQVKRIVSAVNKYNVSYILAESNSIGEPNIERLYEELPDTVIEGVFMDGFKKTKFIENLAVSLERVEYQFLNNDIGKAELEAYEMEMTSTGRPRFNAPSGIHDDTVISRALMLHSINSYIPAVMA
jgi:hypothetical protein